MKLRLRDFPRLTLYINFEHLHHYKLKINADSGSSYSYFLNEVL